MTVTVQPWQAALTFFLILGTPAILWTLFIKVFIIPRRAIAEASIVDVMSREDSNGKMLYCPVYVFADKSHHQRQVCNDLYTNRYVTVGTKRKILYDPHKPNRFSYPGISGIYLGPTILFGAAIVLTLIPLSNYI